MQQLLIFAKEPIVGQVKTRLARSIGHDQAVQVAKNLLDMTVRLALSYQKTAPVPTTIVLVVSPDAKQQFWQEYAAQNIVLESQVDGNLGARLSHAVMWRLHKAWPVVCLGMDCPYLTCEDLQFAFQSLQRNTAVIQPATDGGYVLIGLSEPVPGLFIEMPWSSAELLSSTLAFLRGHSLSYNLARELTDIDDLQDLQQWQALCTRSI